jgi:hypothetical protein
LNGVTFGLCEAVPTGWDLLSISFSINGGAPVSQPLTGDCLTTAFTIPAGTNTFEIIVDDSPSGRINIIKNTVNGDGLFQFTTTQPALNSTFSNFSLLTVANTDETGIITVKPGSYSVTENLAALPGAAWSFTSLICTTGGVQVGTTSTANITITPGDTVTCTYVNTQQVELEACSPGYWKQPQHFGSYPWQEDPWGLLTQSQQVVPVDYAGFDATLYGSIFSSAPAELAGLTFPEVIGLGGGGIYALGRHSAAAYLNSVALLGAYFYSPAQVVQITNDAFDGITTLQFAQSAFSDLLIDENCTLGRDDLEDGDFGNGIGRRK